MRHSSFATRVARMLEHLPWVRRTLSAAYRRVIYAVKWRPGQTAKPADGVSVHDLESGMEGANHQISTFFGYYEKSPWSADGRRILYHRVGAAGERAELMLLDGAKVHALGTTPAWNWQQGAMLQWMSGAKDVALYNDVIGRNLRTRLIDITGKSVGEWQCPVQALSPVGQSAVSLNYLRLQELRPEYGYTVAVDNFSSDMPDDHDGLWVIDTSTGESRLAVSLAQLARLDNDVSREGGRHKINHALYSPSGTSVVFLYRWFAADGRRSRLMVADTSTWVVKPLHESRVISHYCWLNDEELLCWCRGSDGVDAYHRISATHGTVERWMPETLSRWGDGHPNALAGGRQIVTDSYPDERRHQRLLQIHDGDAEPTELGRFLAPWRFDGYTRCDLHPRLHRDGKRICIDSAHTGTRRVYLLTIA